MATQRSGRSPETRNPAPSLVTAIGTSGSAAIVAAGTAGVAGRAARATDLLGRPGPDLPVAGGALRLALRAWEVRTVQLRVEPGS